jgi:hypothetical protein
VTLTVTTRNRRVPRRTIATRRLWTLSPAAGAACGVVGAVGADGGIGGDGGGAGEGGGEAGGDGGGGVVVVVGSVGSSGGGGIVVGRVGRVVGMQTTVHSDGRDVAVGVKIEKLSASPTQKRPSVSPTLAWLRRARR